MRKIRKIAQPETNQESKQAETLLTIPPLLLGNGEFTLSSCSYLMTSEVENKNDSDNKKIDENNGKILFSDFKSQKSSETENLIAKKRKIDSEDEDSNQESNSSSDTENSSDDSENDSDSSNSDSNSD